MWFPLKKRYLFQKEQINPVSEWGQTGVIGVKKGAPIALIINGLCLSLGFRTVILKDLSLDDLEFPDQCVMDEEGTLFCAADRSFVAVGYKGWISPRIHFCPGCGRELEKLPPFPGIEKLKKYELRKDGSAVKA